MDGWMVGSIRALFLSLRTQLRISFSSLVAAVTFNALRITPHASLVTHNALYRKTGEDSMSFLDDD
jgi:hypothetical protein